MRFALSSHRALPAISAETNGEVVELSLLDGIGHEALRDLFVGLWVKDQFRVTLDCSHVDYLALQEVLTLIRFGNEFSCRGGFVRLTKVNARVRSLLLSLRCKKLLAPATHTPSLGSVSADKELSPAQ